MEIRDKLRVTLASFSNLNSQFTRWRQDQHLSIHLSQVQTRQDWQCERTGFTCTSLRLTQQITAFQQWRNRSSLDR